MSQNGDNSNGDAPAGGGIPKLTVSQRILASLPNLQRQPPPPKAPPPARAAGPGRARPDIGAGDGADAVTPDEVLPPKAAASPASPPSRRAPSGMNKEELTHIIKRIDDRERVIAFGSAAIGLGVGIALTIAAIHFNTPHSKNHTSTGFIIFEGAARVVLAAVVVLAAWYRRRSFVAFALLFLGTSMGGIFALPFWAVGIWLIFRVLKWQKELAALTGGQTRPARGGSTAGASRVTGQSRSRPDAATRGREAAEARRRARAERMAQRGAGGRRGKKLPEPTGPAANKRYTPPKPTRSRPPSP